MGEHAPGRLRAAVTWGAATALALPIVEIAVRGLHLAPGVGLIDVTQTDSVYKRSTNPVLGFELKASYRNPEADLVTSYPSTNSHGQRDVERTLEKPPGVRRILVLGASVVEGFGIREIDDTITRQLERMYEGGRTEVLNFGVSAYCTRAKVELLEVKGLAFDPDDVVLFFTQNDFNNFNHEAFALGSPVERPAIVERLFPASHAFRFLCARLNLFYYGTQLDPVAWNRRAIGDNNVVEGLRRLAALAERHGFRPLVAIWPRFTDEEIVDMHQMPGGDGELVVERLARAEGIPSFRFSRHFEMHRASLGRPVNPRKEYTLGDYLHPNVAACRLAAGVLKEELERARPGRLPARETGIADAVEYARRLGEKDPQYSRIAVNLGNTLLAQGRYEEAIRQYREALRMKPDLAEAHNNLGVARKSQGRLDEAIRHYLRALEIDPSFADAHYNLGVALAGKGRHEDAARAFRRALQIRPDFAPARRGLDAALRERNPG